MNDVQDIGKVDSTFGKVLGFGESIFKFAKDGAETVDAVREVIEGERDVQNDRSAIQSAVIGVGPSGSDISKPVQAGLGGNFNIPTPILIGAGGLLALALFLRR